MLASDSHRSWITSLAVVVIALVLSLFQGSLSLTPEGVIWFSVFVAWSVYGFGYLVLTLWVFRGARGAELTRWLIATQKRERSARFIRWLSGGGAGTLSSQASLLAVIAIVIVSFNPELRSQPALLVSSVAVVVASWTLIVVSYAVQYAREQAALPAFEFAGSADARMSDWYYLSVQVSTTFSTSDVAAVSHRARRLVTTHAIIAFVFNTIVVALSVSLLVAFIA